MDEDADYYRILEIDDSAGEVTIKQKLKANYKRLARKHHPDKNPGDENATTRFQKVCHFSAHGLRA
jgi:DnaJ-class molecular chaperone